MNRRRFLKALATGVAATAVAGMRGPKRLTDGSYFIGVDPGKPGAYHYVITWVDRVGRVGERIGFWDGKVQRTPVTREDVFRDWSGP